MTDDELREEVERRWQGKADLGVAPDGRTTISPAAATLPEICGWLFQDLGLGIAGLVVEEDDSADQLRYVFFGGEPPGLIHVLVTLPRDERVVPSISHRAHAADWHEREAEDMFGIHFEGHPRLGDFVLHDDAWQEGVEPMRRRFDAHTAVTDRRPRIDWRPRRIVQDPGAFTMPVGPVFGGGAESVHFQLETVGEDVIRAYPRLFYKYRGIEKLAEGRSAEDALLLAERFSATTAFAHGLAYCLAVERIRGDVVPGRARTLRLFLAELERLRHHVGAIESICESTALVVAASQMAILEEDLLRASGDLAGHRYLFGLTVPGGLARDLNDAALERTLFICRDVLAKLDDLERMLQLSSSFLDRLEEVGTIAKTSALAHGLVGPVARASGIERDLRRHLPYGDYDRLAFDVPVEREGDGYARLRVLFAETRQSVRLMEAAARSAQPGPVIEPAASRAGAAMGWVEAPRGAAFHWVRLDGEGRVIRYHIVPPSFLNWHGLYLSAENFAFQDFPIILATMDLSVAENDR